MKWLNHVFMILSLWTYVVGRGVVPNLEKLMDEILALVRKNITDRIRIPDLFTNWKFKWTLFQVNGQSNCNRGDLHSLRSFKRVDSVDMAATQQKTLISTKLKIKNLVFQFKNCYFHAKNWMNVKRIVKVTIGHNIIGTVILLDNLESKCQSSIKRVVMEKYTDFHLDTNGGPLADLDGKMYQWLIKYFRVKIKPILEKSLANSLRRALLKYDLCAKMGY